MTLRAERRTGEFLAGVLGVARETVRNWFIPNGQEAKGYKPDARVTLFPDAKAKIVEDARGETQARYQKIPCSDVPTHAHARGETADPTQLIGEGDVPTRAHARRETCRSLWAAGCFMQNSGRFAKEEVEHLKTDAAGRERAGKSDPTELVPQGDRHDREVDANRVDTDELLDW